MKKSCRNAGRGYLMVVEPFNICWSYLFSREWGNSAEDTLSAIALLAVLILVSPFVYLCVAPIAAFIEGTKKEEDICL